AGVKLGARNALVLQRGDEKRALKLKEEFMPLGLAATGRVSAPLVFVGYGISAPELKYDDYAGIDVRGKVVLALRFSPDGGDQKGKFSQYAPFRSKATTARDKGAAGILFVTGPLDEQAEDIGVFRVDASFSDGGLPAAIVR